MYFLEHHKRERQTILRRRRGIKQYESSIPIWDMFCDVHVRVRTFMNCSIQISFADYQLYDITKNNLSWAPKLLDSLPDLKGFIERMEKRPNLAKYLASAEHKSFPITPSERLP